MGDLQRVTPRPKQAGSLASSRPEGGDIREPEAGVQPSPRRLDFAVTVHKVPALLARVDAHYACVIRVTRMQDAVHAESTRKASRPRAGGLPRRTRVRGEAREGLRTCDAQSASAPDMRRAHAQGSCAGLMRRAHAQASCARLMRTDPAHLDLGRGHTQQLGGRAARRQARAGCVTASPDAADWASGFRPSLGLNRDRKEHAAQVAPHAVEG
jgi:hypothetical protein